MRAREMVLQRLALTETNDEIEAALTEVAEFIRSYCHLADLPPSLDTLWADMTVDYLTALTGDGEGGAELAVSAVRMGDVSYTFGDMLSTDEMLRQLMRDYRYRLGQVRRGLFR